MLEEQKCPREERVLPLIALCDIDILPSRRSISKFIDSKNNIDHSIIDRYYNWTKSENEIIVYCGFGYCDLPIPKTYSCLIDSANLDKPIDVEATVKFAIWNGLLPIETIAHGHKTICIISFKNRIPVELNQLPDWNNLQIGNYRYDKFGLCDKIDFELIAKKRKR